MNKRLLMNIMLLCVSMGFAQDSSAVNQVRIFYFHTSYRCVNCNNFEKWTKQVVEEHFSKEIKNGSITFASLNIEEDANKQYIKTYQLVTKSVILVKMNGSKELNWKNLDQIWMKARNETKFKQYIKTEIKNMLEKEAL